MACNEPNDPRLPLVGCCAPPAAELFFWTAGDDTVPALTLAQPFEPELFFRISEQRFSQNQVSPIPLLPDGNTDRRFTFSFTGVWQAVPIGVWEVLGGQALTDALPKRHFVGPFGEGDYLDYSLPIFMLCPRLPILPASNFPGVLINSIEGVPLNSSTTYRFDRVIDVWPKQIPDDIIGLPYNLYSHGELPQPRENSRCLITRDEFDQLFQIDRRNGGCPLSGLNLPGLPAVATPFSKGVNVRFLSTYDSADHSPLIIRDNVAPAVCPA